MSEPETSLLIAGGGIGGLAAAVALAKRGVASRVLERQGEFSAAGAGIQIGPNGLRILHDLGVASRISTLAGKPEALNVMDGTSGRRLARLPLGGWIEDRHGAPYWTLHRADLQAGLLAAARAEPLVEIVNGFELVRLETGPDGVAVWDATGRRDHGAGLIGADGLWSQVRRLAFQPPPLPVSTRSAARTLIPIERVGAFFAEASVGIWLAPHAHVVHYPVHGGRQIAVVVVTEDNLRASDWSAEATADEIAARTSALSGELRRFLATAPDWRKWSLYDVAPIPSWTRGRIALLGDAAHPVLPFLAQGGVLALEDAVTLADCLALDGGEMVARLQRYAEKRWRRGITVQAASRRNGAIYHYSGFKAAARNLALSALPPARLMAGYDWLYGWRADGPPLAA